ncbi:unnamed protein product [Peniophora sp. CBMAI 1063]|nr:unnamed protein product [Peniophora sp. CBMAI 1063]
MRAASQGNYDFAILDPAELAAFWRSIEANAAMLRVALKGFSLRHAKLVDHLSSPHALGKNFREDLAEEAQVLALCVEDSNAESIWHSFILLDQDSYLHATHEDSWNDTTQGRDIALRLEIAINWLKDALEVLRGGYFYIENARAALTPVLRLNADILRAIFGQLAESEAPTKGSLGWIRLSHVCSVWRQVLLDMRDLWARDAFTFGAGVARNDILPRAQGTVVSVSARRLPPQGRGRLPLNCETVVSLKKEDVELISRLAAQRLLRDVHVDVVTRGFLVEYDGMPNLVDLIRILGERSQPHLRSVNIRVPWEEKALKVMYEKLPSIHMASHPNLRHMELANVFLPFSLPLLSSLHLICTIDNSIMPDRWFGLFLETLRSSPALDDLRIVGWMFPQPPAQYRKVTLSHLTTLCSTTSEILAFLHLPALQRGYLADLKSLLNARTVLTTVLTRYGYTPHSVQLCQREAPDTYHDRVIVRLRRTPSDIVCPLLSLPLVNEPILEDPGSYLTIAMLCSKSRSRRAISALFSTYATFISPMATTQGLETLAFDNETRECVFPANTSIAETGWLPLMLPFFPSVTTVEIPFRDKDTTFHLLLSLAAHFNVERLPSLSSIRFVGSIDGVDNIMEVTSPLGAVLRARASRVGIAPITSLVVALPDQRWSDRAGNDGLKPVLMKIVVGEPDDNGDPTLTVEPMPGEDVEGESPISDA